MKQKSAETELQCSYSEIISCTLPHIPLDDKNNWTEKWSDFVSDELLTSAFGLFTEELPVVFLVTWIENSEWVWKSPL